MIGGPFLRIPLPKRISELNQLHYKQAKVQNLVQRLDGNVKGDNAPKPFFKVIERQKMQNQTISEFYTDDKKIKYSSNHNDILKVAKTFCETL